MIYIGLLLLVAYITFVFFIAYLKLKDVRNSGYLRKAPLIIKVFTVLTLVIGLVADVTLNVLLSVVLIEIPHEFLTTRRVERLKNSSLVGGGYIMFNYRRWKRNCGIWLCNQLNSFEVSHCD